MQGLSYFISINSIYVCTLYPINKACNKKIIFKWQGREKGFHKVFTILFVLAGKEYLY